MSLYTTIKKILNLSKGRENEPNSSKNGLKYGPLRVEKKYLIKPSANSGGNNNNIDPTTNL